MNPTSRQFAEGYPDFLEDALSPCPPAAQFPLTGTDSAASKAVPAVGCPAAYLLTNPQVEQILHARLHWPES